MFSETTQPNTAMQAMNALKTMTGGRVIGETIQIHRHIAPAGTVSDGARTVYINLRGNARYLNASTYTGEIITDIDQRDYMDEPEALANEMLLRLERLEIMAGNTPPQQPDFFAEASA